MWGEQDFAAYVAARGATVVRCLVLLGRGPADAEEAAAEAFATVRADWAELARYGNADVALYATVLAAEDRRRRRAAELPLGSALVATALRRVAGLDELTACEVLGASVPRLRGWLAAAAVGSAARADEVAEMSVAGPTEDRVRSVVSRRRLRTWRASAAVLAVAAVVLGTAVLVTRPDPPLRPGDAMPAVHAVAGANPADVVWWADGTIHLAAATVEVGDLQQLVAAGDAAAYVDGQGRLVAVWPDGRRRLLGRPAPRTSLVSSPRLGLVAWTDVTQPDAPRIVVWDLTKGERVAGVVTGPRTRAITFDGGWLTFGTGLTDWAWDPHGGPARQTGNGFDAVLGNRSALVDVVAGTRLEQIGYFLRVVHVGSRREVLVPGFGGTLSPEGRFVLTGAWSGHEPSLFDARTGAELGTPFPAEWRVRAAAFVSERRVAWLVDRFVDGRLDGDQLVTCSPRGCDEPVDLDATGTPVIAQDSTR